MISVDQIQDAVRSMKRTAVDAAGLDVNMSAGSANFLVGDDDWAYTNDLFALIAALKADTLGFGPVDSSNLVIIGFSSKLDQTWTTGQLEIPDGFIIDFKPITGGQPAVLNFTEGSPSAPPLKLSGGAFLININFAFSGASPVVSVANEIPTLISGTTYQLANAPIHPTNPVAIKDAGGPVGGTVDRYLGRVTYDVAPGSPTVDYDYQTVDAVECDQTNAIGGVVQGLIDGPFGGINLNGDDWRHGIRIHDSGAEASSAFATALIGTDKPLAGISLDVLVDTSAGSLFCGPHIMRRLQLRSGSGGGFLGFIDRLYANEVYYMRDFGVSFLTRCTVNSLIQETPSGDVGSGQLFLTDTDINTALWSPEFLDIANVAAIAVNSGQRMVPVEVKDAGSSTVVVGAALPLVGGQVYGLASPAVIDLDVGVTVYENGVPASAKDYVLASSGVVTFRAGYGVTTPVTMDYTNRQALGIAGGNAVYIASDIAKRVIFSLGSGAGGGGIARGEKEHFVAGSTSAGVGIYVSPGNSLNIGARFVNEDTLHSLGGESVLEAIAVSDFGGVMRATVAAGYWNYIDRDTVDMVPRSIGGADAPVFGEFLVASGGPYAVTLPLLKAGVPNVGQRIRVLSLSVAPITVAVDSGGVANTIDGTFTSVIVNQYEVVEFCAVTGTNWAIIARDTNHPRQTGDHTAPTVVEPNALVLIDASGGNAAVTLPQLALAANSRFIKRREPVRIKAVDTNAGANTVTITPNATDQIDGGGAGVAITLTIDKECVVLQPDDSTNWQIVGKYL